MIATLLAIGELVLRGASWLAGELVGLLVVGVMAWNAHVQRVIADGPDRYDP